MLSRILEARQALAELGYLADSKSKLEALDVTELRHRIARLKQLNFELETGYRNHEAAQGILKKQLIEIGDKIHEITIQDHPRPMSGLEDWEKPRHAEPDRTTTAGQ